jgi:hypothetical protein
VRPTTARSPRIEETKGTVTGGGCGTSLSLPAASGADAAPPCRHRPPRVRARDGAPPSPSDAAAGGSSQASSDVAVGRGTAGSTGTNFLSLFMGSAGEAPLPRGRAVRWLLRRMRVRKRASYS